MPIANGKNAVSRDQDRKHKKILAECLREPGNKICADCQARGPTWASVNLGVFVCLTCSGIHRSLGVHISQVRSTTLDTWLPKQVSFIKSMGNVKANAYWEHSMGPSFVRPRDSMQLNYFIRSKYLDKQYAPRNQEPPTISNFDENQNKAGYESKSTKEPLIQNKDEKLTHSKLIPNNNPSPVKIENVVQKKKIEQESLKHEKTLDYPEIDLLGLEEVEASSKANDEITISDAINTEWATFEESNAHTASLVGSPSLSWTAFEGPTTTTSRVSDKAESPNPFDFPSDSQGTSSVAPLPQQNPVLVTSNHQSTTNANVGQEVVTTRNNKLINTTEDILKLYDTPTTHTNTTNITNNIANAYIQTQAMYPNMTHQQTYYHQYHQNMYNGIVGNNMVPVVTMNGTHHHHMNYNGNPWNLDSGTGRFGSHSQPKS